MKNPHRRILTAVLAPLAAIFLLRALPVSADDAVGNVLKLGEPTEVGMDAAPLAEIPRRMREFVDQKQIAGAVTLLARQGKVVHLEAVGQADIQSGRPMKKDTIFAIASMTKPITATAVMILLDEGKLSIDDLVSKHIPQFKNASLKDGPPSRELTIRDLITHTSGVGGSQQNQGSLERTVELIADRPLEFEPGSRWKYGPGVTVCGRIVEVVSGRPFDEFLDERILKPAGMVDTTFFPTAEQQKRLARLYKPGPQPGTIELTEHWISKLSPERTPNPSGGLFSTAHDMARFYQMILGGGKLDGRRIVSEESVRRMTRLQTGELTTGFTPGNGWGLGWCVVRQPQGVSRMLSPGTFGHGGAFGTQGWVDPQREMIFVLLIQRSGFGNGDASKIRDVFQELAVRGVEK